MRLSPGRPPPQRASARPPPPRATSAVDRIATSLAPAPPTTRPAPRATSPPPSSPTH